MNITGYHNGQPIVDSIPDGWKVDKRCGSPFDGYVYIHMGEFSEHMVAPAPGYQGIVGKPANANIDKDTTHTS